MNESTRQSNAELRCLLNNLIQTCKDGQEGFQTAAENVADSETKRYFGEYSLQRSEFVGELQTTLRELGDSDPETESTYAGGVHRGWIDLKGAILTEDVHAILVECERGESHAVSEYEKALEADLPANVREIVARQHAAIVECHQQVQALSDAGGPKWA